MQRGLQSSVQKSRSPDLRAESFMPWWQLHPLQWKGGADALSTSSVSLRPCSHRTRNTSQQAYANTSDGTHCSQWECLLACKQHLRICVQICLRILCERSLGVVHVPVVWLEAPCAVRAPLR